MRTQTFYCTTQDEIHKRPRISTLLESLSRYEAVASPQQDDEEGEAKTAKSSQVQQKRFFIIQNKAMSTDQLVRLQRRLINF